MDNDATQQPSPEPTVAVPQSTWDALQRRLAALEDRVFDPPQRQPVSVVDSSPAPAAAIKPDAVTPPAAPPGEGSPTPLNRRRAMAKMFGAAAAVGAGAVVASAGPAAAADNSNLVIGNLNNADTKSTQLTVSAPQKIAYGLGIIDHSYPGGVAPCAFFGHAANGSFGTAGVFRGVNGATGLEVDSDSTYAATFYSDSTNYTVVIGNTDTGGGLRLFSKAGHHLFLDPAGLTVLDANVPGAAGEIRVTQDGSAWFCVANGSPGTWRRLAGPTSAGSLHVLPTPVRVYDSRPGTQPSTGPKTPLQAGSTRVLDLKGNNSGVPGGATAALVSVLLVNAKSGNGNFTIWANGKAQPSSNTLVWGGSAGRFTTSATTALDASAKCQVAASLTTDLVLDVVGYYR